MMRYCFLLFVLLIRTAYGAIPEDGNCSLLTFLPFTANGTDLLYISNNDLKRRNNFAFSQMASAVLAATHFNERNPSVVPELEDPSFKECNFEFDLNNLIFFDSDLVEHKALVQLQDYILNNGPPCAVTGPYDDDQVMEVSVLASSVQVPLVNHHGFDLELSFDWSHPFLTQSNPFPFDYIQSIYSYVMDKGRTNFIAILSSRQPSSQHLGEGLATFLQTMGVSTRIFPYAESLDQVVRLFDEELASLEGAMTKIKDTGFRTIIVIPESFDIMDKFVTMGKEAESLKINTGEYFWLFITELPLEVINENMTANENVTKLLAGAALFHAVEGFSVDEDKDRFLQSWRNQNTSAVELLKKLNPIPKGMPGYYEPSDDYFSTVDPETGAAFLYDAVMSIGFGACLAGPKGGINGSSHVRGIQSSEFAGASGRVLYGGGSVLKGNGVRNTYSAMYGVYNLLPPGGNVTWVLTDLLDPSNSSVTARNSGATKGWISLKEFVFADGRSVGPDLLVLAGQNYLSPGVRAIGFALFSIAVASGIASIFWIIIYRKHQVLRAAQPSFLLIVCTGAMIMSYTILSISFEENNGLTEDQLSKLCVSGPWALILGHILIYSALFAKLYRVNQVLQFTRVKVDVNRVLWFVRFMALFAIAILSTWTAVSNYGWERQVDQETGESFGSCGKMQTGWIVAAACLMIVSTLLALIMSWKTKDVDESFSEAWWIFALIFVQLQSILLSVPILIILNGVSTDGRYIGGTFMIFVLSMSTIGLIMLPKVLAFYGIYGSTTAKRGARGNPVKVSGLAASSNQDPNANALREQISSNQDSRRLDEEEKAPEERLTGSSGVEP